ncbi:2-keto-3-deoxy-6-phosphogluconate aldolase [Sinorhizobium medicae]
MNAPFDHAAKLGIVPVIAIERASDAIALADALLEGGLPLAEITFRTVAAAEVIAIMAEKRPELLVGAGTILTPEALAAAIGCGRALRARARLRRRDRRGREDQEFSLCPRHHDAVGPDGRFA